MSARAAASALLGGVISLSLFASLSSAELAQKQGVRISVSAKLSPNALPRTEAIPVAVTLGGQIASAGKGPAPQLKRMAFAINSHGHLSLKGLPICRVGHIQPSSNSEAMEACGDSLIGHGFFKADVKLPEQSPFPSEGKMLAFNGKLRGAPAILAHIYGTKPASTSYTLPFKVKRTKGTYGTLLEANLPQISGEWGSIKAMSMTLDRTFPYKGKAQGYLSADCPAPKGFQSASFPLVKSTFGFQEGLSLDSVLNRTCKVKG